MAQWKSNYGLLWGSKNVVMKPSTAAWNFRVEQALPLKTPTIETSICKTINLSFHSVH